ncbi:MAG: hypothetical protein ACLQVD_00030 [Capsulimonadaceae bacterium]
MPNKQQLRGHTRYEIVQKTPSRIWVKKIAGKPYKHGLSVASSSSRKFYTLAGGSVAGGAFFGASLAAVPGAVVGGLLGLGVAALTSGHSNRG